MTTAYMVLDLPVVSSTLGTTWATMLNAAITLIDAHDHSSGKGTKVTPDGFTMTGDLDFLQYNAKNLNTCRFYDVGSTYTSSPDLNCCYVNSGEFYFTDALGNAVQITSGGSVNVSGSGSITGLGGTSAALTYSDSIKCFTFTQDANFAAKINCGDISIREVSAGITNTVTLKSPTSLAASYNIEFPAAVPASDSLVLMNSSGVLSLTRTPIIDTLGVTTATIIQTNTTNLKITSGAANNYALKSDASGNTSWAKLTQSSMGSVGQQISSANGGQNTTSSSYVDCTNLTVTITTNGRPVILFLIPNSTSGGYVGLFGTSMTSGSNFSAYHEIMRDSTEIAVFQSTWKATPLSQQCTQYVPCGCIHHIDVVSAGTYVYKIRMKKSSDWTGNTYAYMGDNKLIAYEL